MHWEAVRFKHTLISYIDSCPTYRPSPSSSSSLLLLLLFSLFFWKSLTLQKHLRSHNNGDDSWRNMAIMSEGIRHMIKHVPGQKIMRTDMSLFYFASLLPRWNADWNLLEGSVSLPYKLKSITEGNWVRNTGRNLEVGAEAETMEQHLLACFP